MTPETPHTHRPWRLVGLSGLATFAVLVLFVLGVSLAQPPPLSGGGPGSPEERDRDRSGWRGEGPFWRDRGDDGPRQPSLEFADVPELTTAPEGVFNRVRQGLITRQQQLRGYNDQVMQQARQLEEIRQRNPYGRPRLRDLPEVRDALAQMHETVNQMVTEAENARRYLETEVVPHLGEMLSEVQAERAAIPPDDPRQERLRPLEEKLTEWTQNPEAALDLFEPSRRPHGGPPGPDDEGEPGFPDERRLLRRLDRMEAMQRHLQEQLNFLQRETERIRGHLEELPPEDLERLDQEIMSDPAEPPPPPSPAGPAPHGPRPGL